MLCGLLVDVELVELLPGGGELFRLLLAHDVRDGAEDEDDHEHCRQVDEEECDVAAFVLGFEEALQAALQDDHAQMHVHDHDVHVEVREVVDVRQILLEDVLECDGSQQRGGCEAQTVPEIVLVLGSRKNTATLQVCIEES